MTFLPPRSADWAIGAERRRAAAQRLGVDREGVVRGTGDPRPRPGCHRVPPGAGVGWGLGEHAAATGRCAAAQQVGKTWQRAAPAVVGVFLDQVLAHPVGGEQQHGFRLVVVVARPSR
jgi:hypothetical protein